MKNLLKMLLTIIKYFIIIIFAMFVIIGIIIGILVLITTLKEKEFDKYAGHGFDYMHGYSSTDLSGYHVYDGDKLVKLDHEPEFIIEDIEDMPILDGAEACYPVYTAIAKTLYKDIDIIEKEVIDNDKKNWTDLSIEERDYLSNNGKIVTFTNTKDGYYRLIDGEVDLFIGAKASQEQLKHAKDVNKEIIYTNIGKEAFVFFVEEDNPIDNLTSDQIRKIYSGEITNWNELGGKNQKIIAFQRPEDSGSQVMMHYFMKDIPLKEADTVERVSAMGGVIKQVKQYHNEKGAIGYTFRYFLEGLNQEKGVKILSIDGIYPSVENIKNNTYPVLADLVCSRIKNNNKENIDKVIEFMLSKDGQYIIEKTGYGPLN